MNPSLASVLDVSAGISLLPEAAIERRQTLHNKDESSLTDDLEIALLTLAAQSGWNLRGWYVNDSMPLAFPELSEAGQSGDEHRRALLAAWQRTGEIPGTTVHQPVPGVFSI
jgi:hypothetical protein